MKRKTRVANWSTHDLESTVIIEIMSIIISLLGATDNLLEINERLTL